MVTQTKYYHIHVCAYIYLYMRYIFIYRTKHLDMLPPGNSLSFTKSGEGAMVWAS
jgi:hypothetical protein